MKPYIHKHPISVGQETWDVVKSLSKEKQRKIALALQEEIIREPDVVSEIDSIKWNYSGEDVDKGDE